MTTEILKDYFPREYADQVLARLPAPISPVTGEPLWERGVRLHAQQGPLVWDPYRFKKADGGIRFGKSFAPAVALYLDMLWRTTQRKITTDRYAVVGSTFRMAEEEMNHLHGLLEGANIPHEFRTPEGDSWKIKLVMPEDLTFETLTSAELTRIAAKPYRAVVMAEAAQQSPDVLDKCIGRVSQGRGWVMMTGTFEKQKGRWYARLTEQWKREGALGKVYTCPSWDNPIAYPGGFMDEEIQARSQKMPRNLFLEMYGGEPQMPSDTVFPEANERHHIRRRFPLQMTSYDPELPVFLFVDPGVAHAYAVAAVQFGWTEEYAGMWAQAVRGGAKGKLGRDTGNIAWVIDVIYRWNRETEMIVNECTGRPWAKQVEDIVVDFAGRQRRAEGPPVIEQWAKFWMKATGRRLSIHADQVPLQDGYRIHRAALRNAWPEAEAAGEFNYDQKLPGRVTDPTGLRLYIDPGCSAPFFGGMVDAVDFGGEYYLHRNQKDAVGTITQDEPRDDNNDLVKAINYGLHWWVGPGRVKRWRQGVTSVPWEIS